MTGKTHRKLQDVALGDGGIKAGAGVQVHELADCRKAEVGEEDFGRDAYRVSIRRIRMSRRGRPGPG